MPSSRFFVVLIAVECVAILVAWVLSGMPDGHIDRLVERLR